MVLTNAMVLAHVMVLAFVMVLGRPLRKFAKKKYYKLEPSHINDCPNSVECKCVGCVCVRVSGCEGG